MGKSVIADIPGFRDVVEIQQGSKASGIATTSHYPLHVVGRDATFTGAYWIPTASVAGATDHTRSIDILNNGSTGTETTVMASVNLTADALLNKGLALTLTAVASDLALEAGDVISMRHSKTGNGVNIPGATIQVEYT